MGGSFATRTRAGCIVGLVGLAVVVVSADEDPPMRAHPAVTRTARSDAVHRPGVRILSPQMAPNFQEGLSRSPTLRSLVDAIDASDGVVYVEYGVCKSVARSCLPGSIIVAGPNRLLRVVIRETQLADDLVVSIGHELQHAVEILGDPAVTTPAQMLFLFRQIGIRSGSMFETIDAIRVGEAIGRELAASARRGGDTRSR